MRQILHMDILFCLISSRTASFSKKKCGPPDSKVVIVNIQDETPDILTLHKLASLTSISSPPRVVPTTTSSVIELPTIVPSTMTTTAISHQQPLRESSSNCILQISMVDPEGGVSITTVRSSLIKPKIKRKRQKRKQGGP